MVVDLEQERKTVNRVLRNTLDKYRNEHNVNVIEHATEQLDEDFAYVPIQYTMWEGRYVRYADLKSPLELRFKNGGFVVKDNTYTVTLKNDMGIFRVGKRGKLFFMKMSERDLRHIEFKQLL